MRMAMINNARIVRTKYGYYALYLDGVFQGNFDTYGEAAQEMDSILYPEEAFAR